MYHPQVVAASRLTLEQHFKRSLVEHTPAEVEEMTARLSDAVDDKGRPRRELAREEGEFIENELLLTKIDYRYAATRYHKINVEGRELAPMSPLLETQELILEQQGELELTAEERGDGILVLVLKARQVGETTLAMSQMAHRGTTQNDVLGLFASDVPDNSTALFEIFERIYDNLPWWLRPRVTDRVKGSEIAFDGRTHLWVGSGKSTRGKQGDRGQLGRGKTLSIVHLSELSTWEDTKQIAGALMPTLHRDPRLLVQFESTAKGRGNWWHKAWLAATKRIGRFTPIFIPWYAETRKYRLPAPPAWSPAQTTLEHAKKCEFEGPRWTRKRVSLTRDQLYWYETTRRAYEEDEDAGLSTFLEEYAADPEEAFQFSGRGIFPSEVIERVDRQRRDIAGVYDVGPSVEVQRP